MDQMRRFTSQLGIKFQNLHDQNSKIGQLYQAHSIPTLYMISPNWKIVGVFRGARDWSYLLEHNILESLLSKKIATKEDFLKFKKKQKNPQYNITPPRIKILNQTYTYSINKPFDLSLQIQLPGSTRDYMMAPPNLNLPESIQILGVRSQSSSHVEIDNQGPIYIYRLEGHQKGKIKFGPIEIKYKPRWSIGEFQYMRGPEIELYFVKKQLFLILMVTFLILVVIITSIFYFLKKKKSLRKNSSHGKNCNHLFKSKWIEIQKIKERGDIQSYSLELVYLYLKIFNNPEDFEKYNSCINRIKYANENLSSEEKNFFEKRVDNYINNKQKQLFD